jgi:hypothetical protein
VAVYAEGTRVRVAELEAGGETGGDLRKRVNALADLAVELGGYAVTPMYRQLDSSCATRNAEKEAYVRDANGFFVGESAAPRTEYPPATGALEAITGEGTLLACLVSAQPVPVLVTLRDLEERGERVAGVALFSTLEMTPTLGRLRVMLERRGIPVQVFTLGRTTLEVDRFVTRLFKVALERRVVLNVNGGTAAMLYGAHQAFHRSRRDGDRLEYIAENTVRSCLDDATRVVRGGVGSALEVLALHGIEGRLKDPDDDSPDTLELASQACRAIGKNPVMPYKHLEFFRRTGKTESGDAAEHVVRRQLAAYGFLECAIQVYPQRWEGSASSGADRRSAHFHGNDTNNEVDAIGVVGHRLVMVEVKNALREPIKYLNRNSFVRLALARRSGGRYARYMIVAVQARNTTKENERAEILQLRRSRFDDISVWMLEPETLDASLRDALGDALYEFPADLERFMAT